MKLIRKFAALLLLISFLPLSLTSCVLEEFIPDFILPEESDSYANVRDTVMVSVLDGANYEVTSKNPIRVTKGSDAKFNIELDYGFEYISSIEGATYENGVLTVPNVQKPTSVSITLKIGDVVMTPGHNWALDISKNETHHWYDCHDAACTDRLSYEPHTGGLATYYEKAVCDVCGVEYGETVPIPEFETVTLEATAPEEGYKFLCWTVDVPLTEGGEIITDKSDGTFDIPFESTPVENYVDTGHHVVMYRCNGGKTAAVENDGKDGKDTIGGKDYLYSTFSNKYYQMPNTIHQNGTFVRNGYTLVRYNEKPDGTGDYATLGGKIEVGDTGLAELYLIWQRNTAVGLEYTLRTDGGRTYASVSKYVGNETSVVIPDSYEGYSVEHISAYAFSNLPITSVAIPKSVITIEKNAFDNCEMLRTITMHDGIREAYDESFSGCPITKLYLNASRGPVTPGTPAMTALKYERLRMAAKRGEKKILVISGSSSLHGFRAEVMQNAFNDEYTVINYGTNAGANTFLYLSAFMKFFSEGDIVIHAPEMTSGPPLGDSKVHSYTFRYAECMLDIFSYIDISHFKGFFEALAEFNNKIRFNNGVPVAEKRYDEGTKTLNEYCDLINGYLDKNYKPENPGGTNAFKLTYINEDRTSNMNLINSMLKDRGATLYYSFAPICDTCLSSESLSESVQAAYVEKLESMIDFEVISKPSDYILPESVFNDSNFHPNKIGAIMRTERLAADLKAALAKEGD